MAATRGCTILILTLALYGCSGAAQDQGTPRQALRPVQLASGERLRVVATSTLVADVVAFVGGEAIGLTTLMPIGTDLHLFDPTPRDLLTVSDAHVLFLSGMGLEQSLESLLADAGVATPMVSLSTGVSPRYQPVPGAEGGTPLPAGSPDPHVWLDPNNVIIWTENAANALMALDPGGSEEYAARANDFRSQLEALDVWIQEQVAEIAPARRVLVTDHEVLGYFAQRYGFELLGSLIPSTSTGAEPTARQLASLEAAMGAHDVRAVFVEVGGNLTLAQRVSADTGAQLVPLYLASLSAPDGPAPGYVALMRYNVQAIVTALGG